MQTEGKGRQSVSYYYISLNILVSKVRGVGKYLVPSDKAEDPKKCRKCDCFIRISRSFQ